MSKKKKNAVQIPIEQLRTSDRRDMDFWPTGRSDVTDGQLYAVHQHDDTWSLYCRMPGRPGRDDPAVDACWGSISHRTLCHIWPFIWNIGALGEAFVLISRSMAISGCSPEQIRRKVCL